MSAFEVKIAQNQEEIKRALRLRHDVFTVEMGSHCKGRDGLEIESDIYDSFSDHLLVIDKACGKVVGTYRLILGSKVDKKVGFYSERFFHISNIKKLAHDSEILELGRSCIHRDYRNQPVINHLWGGIADYVKQNKVRYLFGSVRLLSNEPDEVSRTFKFMKSKFYSSPKYRVRPKAAARFGQLDESVKIDNPVRLFRSLPPLVKGYVRAGVKVCGLPAKNFDLGSLVIFILLDIENMSGPYRKHYL